MFHFKLHLYCLDPLVFCAAIFSLHVHRLHLFLVFLKEKKTFFLVEKMLDL